MHPDNSQQSGRSAPTIPSRQYTPTTPARDYTATQNAAAEVIRGQLDAIYAGKSGEATPHTTPIVQNHQDDRTKPQPTVPQPNTKPNNPEPTPMQHGLRTTPPPVKKQDGPTTRPTPTAQQQTIHYNVDEAQWKQYHSSWQKYYQMYYERYYANHLTVRDQEISRLSDLAAKQEKASSSVNQSFDQSDPQATAMKELRGQIQQKVRDSAKKVRKSRHFVPAMAGVTVLLIFMFLQYNRVLFGAVAAYASPGNIEPQNIIVDASADVAVGPEPRMIIPKINIDAPVVYGAASDLKSQSEAMQNGIAHFSIPGASAVPGQIGNAVFAAHSSNDAFASGDYKFVFAKNEKLTKGDVIYMNYEGKRYTYAVTSTEVVMPTEVSKVQLQTDKPMLTLVSCVPVGTADKRLLVFAEQISPNPNTATAAEETSTATTSNNMPGNPSPTLLERLFGAN